MSASREPSSDGMAAGVGRERRTATCPIWDAACIQSEPKCGRLHHKLVARRSLRDLNSHIASRCGNRIPGNGVYGLMGSQRCGDPERYCQDRTWPSRSEAFRSCGPKKASLHFASK